MWWKSCIYFNFGGQTCILQLCQSFSILFSLAVQELGVGSVSSYVAFETNCFHVKNYATWVYHIKLMITPNKYFGLWKNQDSQNLQSAVMCNIKNKYHRCPSLYQPGNHE